MLRFGWHPLSPFYVGQKRAFISCFGSDLILLVNYDNVMLSDQIRFDAFTSKISDDTSSDLSSYRVRRLSDLMIVIQTLLHNYPMNTNKIKVTGALLEGAWVTVEELLETPHKRKKDHRKLPRAKRPKFRHLDALFCIQRDYLGLPNDPSIPLLSTELKKMFRMSRSRFQVLMEDIKASKHPFFQRTKTLHQDDQASFEAQLLLPIKSFAFGVPTHTFIDYFQMSREYARECCKQFDIVMKKVYAT
jgi:hypothetical protein